MPPSEIVSPHGVFRGCFFYVQVCDRSPLAVQDDIRILKMCGGQVMHHPLSQKVTHYIVEAKTERPHYVHRIKGGRRPYPGEGKEFTLDDLVKVATTCQGQITVVQSAWIAECRDRGRQLGPTEDCGGWIVKAIRAHAKAPPAEVHQASAPRTSDSRLLGTKLAATTPSWPSSALSLNPRTVVASLSDRPQVASASTPSPVASITSLLSPITPSTASPMHSPDDTTSVPPWERRRSTTVKSTFSTTPAFLKSSTRRNHAQNASPTVKRIPNTARVRNSTMGDFEIDVNYKQRSYKAPTRSGSVSSESADVNGRADPPKRPRLDLSTMKFTKISSPQKGSSTPSTHPRSATKTRPSRAASDRRVAMLPHRMNSSRSSTPEESLFKTSLPEKLGSRPVVTSPAQPSATFNPYPSPSLTLSPLEDALEDYPPCDDLFLGTDKHPLRFFLDDASHACFAGTILVSDQFAGKNAN